MKLQTTDAITEIRKLHSELETMAESALEKATRIGELLTVERQKLKHGEWLPWLKANFTFTDRTARNWMRVYENRGRIKLESVSDLNAAYKLLKPAPPDAELPEEIATHSLPNGFLPDGFGLRGVRRYDDGREDEVWIVESVEHPGYYYVSMMAGDFVGGAVAQGGLKPYHKNAVGWVLNHEGVNIFNFQWEQTTAKWSYNRTVADK